MWQKGPDGNHQTVEMGASQLFSILVQMVVDKVKC